MDCKLITLPVRRIVIVLLAKIDRETDVEFSESPEDHGMSGSRRRVNPGTRSTTFELTRGDLRRIGGDVGET